jgi:hypothetical protein
MNLRNLAIWGAILVAAVLIYSVMQGQTRGGAAPTDIPYSALIAKIDQGDAARVNVSGSTIDLTDKTGHDFRTVGPSDNDSVLQQQLEQHKDVTLVYQRPGPNLLVQLLLNMAPLLLLFGVTLLFMRQMQGGARGAMGFGKSKARLLTENKNRVTFEDVAGVDEAKEDLTEIVDFLKDPAKFQRLGGKIPKGALMVGPPGPARPCSAAPSPARRACPSSSSPARTSSRCSSASAPAACATCSSRRRRTAPASSSSTRSTPSAVTAGRASAAAHRLSGDQARAETSFQIVAPAATAARATAGFMVSIEIGTALSRRTASITGMTRAISSASATGSAPGRVDSPPTSRMSAPSAISRRAWEIAALGSRKRPPSEKLSGVTLTIPMTRGGRPPPGCFASTRLFVDGRVSVRRARARRRAAGRSGRSRVAGQAEPKSEAPAGPSLPAHRGADECP